jgi:hypothetical protein
VAAHAAKAWVRFPIRFVTRSSVRSGEDLATGLRLLLVGRLADLGTDLGEVPVDRPAGAAADELDVAVGLVVAALRPEVVETWREPHRAVARIRGCDMNSAASFRARRVPRGSADSRRS